MTPCKWLLSILALGTGLLPPVAGAAPRSYIDHKVPQGIAQLPFSDAVLSGDTLYVAGHLGIDPRTGSTSAAGLTMDDLVSVTVYCTDLDLYDTFNAIYRTYFHGHYPARAFIGSDKLLRGAHFEVQGLATRATL